MPTTFGNQPIRSGSELPIYDVQGNQRAATASNQTVTGTQIFDAFGNQVAATGSTASALQWQGANLYRTYAPDAGLLQAGARYYDPQVGRFVTRDTHLDQHLYIYCGGDPVSRVDPTGHGLPTWVWVGASGAGILCVGAIAFMAYEVYDGIRTGNEARDRLNKIGEQPDTWMHMRNDAQNGTGLGASPPPD
jgi:RHS repeat-associated protein